MAAPCSLRTCLQTQNEHHTNAGYQMSFIFFCAETRIQVESFYRNAEKRKLVQKYPPTLRKMLSYSVPSSMGPLLTFRTFVAEFFPIDMTLSKYVTI